MCEYQAVGTVQVRADRSLDQRGRGGGGKQ